MFKGDCFFEDRKLDISVFQKEENNYRYIPANSDHQKHMINSFILEELRRYVRFNTKKRNFAKIKNIFFGMLRNRDIPKSF